MQRAALLLLLASPTFAQSPMRSSIVKVYTTSQAASYSKPWEMKSQTDSTGSGCIIAGQRILTNAHVVSDHTFIRVRRAGQAEKFVAEVLAVSHELDLALLTVKDKSFFQNSHAFGIGELPAAGESVVALGFPTGGTRLTVTKGVVSRIDRQRYSHSGFRNLVCQIDAAINSGASGGPVLKGDKIVGVVFQSRGGSNIGYMVPAPVILHFLKDLKDGSHDGTPELPIHWQVMENPQLRAQYAMGKGQAGILLRQVSPPFDADDKLRKGDVLLALDGRPIANDGTISLRPDERISLLHAVDRKHVGDALEVRLLRAGKQRTVKLPLTVAKATFSTLVRRRRYGERPSYYIVGGMVFAALTANYFDAWDKWKDAPGILRRYWGTVRTTKNAARKEVVVLIDVLPDELNVGYTGFEDDVVESVNGTPIHSLKDLIAAVENHKAARHRILFEDDQGEIVFDAKLLKERGALILKKYRVPTDRSGDLNKPEPAPAKEK